MKPSKDSQLKILRTFTLPESAVHHFRAEKDRKPVVVNVYSEHGPPGDLLV